jgi:hypothetical protein
MSDELLESALSSDRQPPTSVKVAEKPYTSAIEAFRAGARRGAKFGGTCMGLILGSIIFVLFVAMCGMVVYCILRWPNYNPPGFLESLKLVGICVFGFLYSTLVCAALSAIIMGIGECVSFWRSKGETKHESNLSL